jgi:hypothetical protein
MGREYGGGIKKREGDTGGGCLGDGGEKGIERKWDGRRGGGCAVCFMLATVAATGDPWMPTQGGKVSLTLFGPAGGVVLLVAEVAAGV